MASDLSGSLLVGYWNILIRMGGDIGNRDRLTQGTKRVDEVSWQSAWTSERCGLFLGSEYLQELGTGTQ